MFVSDCFCWVFSVGVCLLACVGLFVFVVWLVCLCFGQLVLCLLGLRFVGCIGLGLVVEVCLGLLFGCCGVRCCLLL